MKTKMTTMIMKFGGIEKAVEIDERKWEGEEK
jgi:hypothetical protein